MLTNRRRIQIEWGDCDPARTVFFPRYIEFGDACTNALFTLAGLPKQAMFKTYNISGIPLVDVRARFIVPSSFGDEVDYETSTPEWGRSSFLVQHKVYRPDRVLALEIFERRVWVVCVCEAPIQFRSEPIPGEVKKRFTDPMPSLGV
jgi:4-hydroxybenzoyl-CoA thioesterase